MMERVHVGRYDGPAIVTLIDDNRTPLPCDDAHVEGDVLFAVLDGRPRCWNLDAIFSVKWIGGGGATLTRSRNPQRNGRPPRMTIDVARQAFRRRPFWLEEER
jgi:hypothetical protein